MVIILKAQNINMEPEIAPEIARKPVSRKKFRCGTLKLLQISKRPRITTRAPKVIEETQIASDLP